MTTATEVRLFACKSSLADAACTDEASDALVTFVVLPSEGQPNRNNITPNNVAPIPIGIIPSDRFVIADVLDFDLTTHTVLKTTGNGSPGEGTTYFSTTPPAATTSSSVPGATPVPDGTPSNNVYQVDTDNRTLLLPPKETPNWPVTLTFDGGYNTLLRIKTKSLKKAGVVGPVFVKLFARRPGAAKTAIATIQVQ